MKFMPKLLCGLLGQVRAGKVKGLAVTTAKRTSLAPDLPTITESGLPGFDIGTWFGIFVPAGTPGEEFAACIQREAEKYAHVIKASGAKAD